MSRNKKRALRALWLAVFSAFTSMVDMGRRLYPFVPISLLLEHRFENETKLKQIRVPALLFHGRRDSIIPVDMSAKLERAAAGPVQRIVFEEADHNDIYEIAGDELLMPLKAFLDKLR